MVQEAYDIGRRYEATLDRRARDLGAHFTPPEVARGLVDLALRHRRAGEVRTVVDPTCGGGAFLIAAADALVARGTDPRRALGAIHGADTDPGAVAACREALHVWAHHHGLEGPDADGAAVAVGDGFELLDDLSASGGGIDLVVGNPPFRSQLRGAAVHDGTTRASLQARFGAVAHGYTDLAGLFLVASVRSLAPGGVAALVQPRSVAAAANAAGVREAVTAGGSLSAIWVPGEAVFDAQVQVCAPVVRAAAPEGRGRVEVLTHLDDEPVATVAAPPGGCTWSTFVAASQGVPAVEAPSGRCVGDAARVTAGFRDEYYGLLDVVAEAVDGDAYGDDAAGPAVLRLATSGSIDVGRHLWGERPQRFGRRRWQRPVIAPAGVADVDGLRRWWTGVRRPKVLVATQTRVVEAVADPQGLLAPVTPVVSVVPFGDRPDADALAAALCAPVVAALAQHRAAGSGMSPTTIRLRAADVAALPLPRDGDTWARATEAFRVAVDRRADAGAWRAYAALADEAHGCGDRGDLVEWWADASRLGTCGSPRERG